MDFFSNLFSRKKNQSAITMAKTEPIRPTLADDILEKRKAPDGRIIAKIALPEGAHKDAVEYVEFKLGLAGFKLKSLQDGHYLTNLEAEALFNESEVIISNTR